MRNHPNETVGAVPACPPERPRSGVSMPKHTHCARGFERWMRPCRATRAGTQAPPLPIPIIFFHASCTNKITIYAQSTQTTSTTHAQSTQTTSTTHAQSTQTTSTVPHAIHPNEINHPHVIHPNETVGAAPMCPPERPRSGVSMPKIHALCVGI